LCILSPKNLKTIGKFVNIDYAEAWENPTRKPSGFFQELKAVVLNLGSIEPIGFDKVFFTFSYIGQKWGFNKNLDNYIRIWCACKG